MLPFYATGDSYASLQYRFNISKQILSPINPEVCCAMIDSLNDYVTVVRFIEMPLVRGVP